MKGLFQDGVINFNREKGKWECDVEEIRKIDASPNIIDFLLNKLAALGERTRETIKLAACLGNTFQLSFLSFILKKDPIETIQSLEEAIRDGVIIPLDRGYRLLNSISTWNQEDMQNFDSLFKFQHDRVQQAVYSMLDDASKQKTHLFIAQVLDEQRQKGKIDATEVARHYLEAYTLIESPEEKRRLIELNMHVAKKAIDANAYKQADQYIRVAIKFAEETCREENRQLLLNVYGLAAEIAFQLGDIPSGNGFIRLLLDHTGDKTAKAEILTLKAIHMSAAGYMREAVNTSIMALKTVGYSFPKTVKVHHVAIATAKFMMTLGFRHPYRFLKNPPLTDLRHDIALKNYALIGQTCFNLGDANGYSTAFFEGAVITMKHGISNLSAYIFATTAAVLIAVFKLTKMSRLFSEMAIKLEETTEDLFIKANCATILSCFNYFWHYDHKILPKKFAETLQLAYQTGNNFYRAATAACYTQYMPDLELKKAHEMNVKMMAIASEANSPRFLEAIQIIQGGFANLLGVTTSPFNLDYTEFSERKMRRHVITSENQMGYGAYAATKLEVLVLREKWSAACKHASKGRKYILGVYGTKYEMLYRFYKFLALVQDMPKMKGPKRWLYILDAMNERKIISIWYKNNPGSFGMIESIVSAENCALQRKPLDETLKMFEKAIEICKAHSAKMHALACHRAFLYAKSKGFDRIGQIYL
ncbi:MAG: hypothetical protein HQK54_17945, partial [Oligoflexales bacterium]|nr:hypothetical protein [Oligoflexales bacterium]